MSKNKELTLEELLEKVNKKLVEQKIVVESGRVNNFPSVRDIRYYQTLHLLPNPTKINGKARYNKEHVDRVLYIKMAQARGLTLAQIAKNIATSSENFWQVHPAASTPVLMAEDTADSATTTYYTTKIQENVWLVTSDRVLSNSVAWQQSTEHLMTFFTTEKQPKGV